jgi:hypothetical protein
VRECGGERTDVDAVGIAGRGALADRRGRIRAAVSDAGSLTSRRPLAEHASLPYRVLGNLTPWLKIRNPHHTQAVGRHEFFNGLR